MQCMLQIVSIAEKNGYSLKHMKYPCALNYNQSKYLTMYWPDLQPSGLLQLHQPEAC